VPPCPFVTISYAKDKPKPVPSPVGLVVKKGWKLVSRRLDFVISPMEWVFELQILIRMNLTYYK
jgi:hypothetical protein